MTCSLCGNQTDYCPITNIACVEILILFLPLNFQSMPEVKANLESTSPSAVDLDSDDDDLKPMGEYSDEVKVTGPAYLRDCMRGLMETQNRDLFERSLKSAPALIRANTHMLQEVRIHSGVTQLWLDGMLHTHQTSRHNQSLKYGETQKDRSPKNIFGQEGAWWSAPLTTASPREAFNAHRF